MFCCSQEHNLDYQRLLDSSDYKEQYRKDMIQWGENRRIQEPSFFCRLATDIPESKCSVWIISDARRWTDLSYFRTTYLHQTIAVRIQADESVRKERDFIFTQGNFSALKDSEIDFSHI